MKELSPGDIVVVDRLNIFDSDIARVLAVDVEHPMNATTRYHTMMKGGRWVAVELYNITTNSFKKGVGWDHAVLPSKIVRKIDSVEQELLRRQKARDERAERDRQIALERDERELRLSVTLETLRRLGVNASNVDGSVSMRLEEAEKLVRNLIRCPDQ